MKNTSQSKKNSGREYISYNTNRVIIFGTDGSKFKLRSVFDILTGKINMFVNKIMYVKRGYIPDGSGVWYGGSVCPEYENCCNDNLELFFSKKLDVIH